MAALYVLSHFLFLPSKIINSLCIYNLCCHQNMWRHVDTRLSGAWLSRARYWWRPPRLQMVGDRKSMLHDNPLKLSIFAQERTHERTRNHTHLHTHARTQWKEKKEKEKKENQFYRCKPCCRVIFDERLWRWASVHLMPSSHPCHGAKGPGRVTFSVLTLGSASSPGPHVFALHALHRHQKPQQLPANLAPIAEPSESSRISTSNTLIEASQIQTNRMKDLLQVEQTGTRSVRQIKERRQQVNHI